MGDRVGQRVRGVALMLLLYLVVQAFVVLAHEHTHSTVAWLLGYSRTPFTVVWGNLVTLRGWDEGVDYDTLFPRPGNPAEAAIGGSPLALHALLIALCLPALGRSRFRGSATAFFALYWLTVLNLAELIAYLWMRPFISTGDTGRFAQGLNISNWWLFLFGSAFLLVTLSVFTRRVVPRVDAFTGGGAGAHRSLMVATAFVLFLWASGLRFLTLYPDPLWRVGLLGLVSFAAWLALAARRGRST